MWRRGGMRGGAARNSRSGSGDGHKAMVGRNDDPRTLGRRIADLSQRRARATDGVRADNDPPGGREPGAAAVVTPFAARREQQEAVRDRMLPTLDRAISIEQRRR